MFIDLKKAFDIIGHNILNKKAENMGFTCIVINSLRSYLNNRKQYEALRNNKCSLRCCLWHSTGVNSQNVVIYNIY